MPNYCDQFKNKKITIMGLGLLGRGLGDAKFFAECGAKILITDLKTRAQLKASVDELNRFIKAKKLKAISYKLGQHRLADFRHADLVIKAAGVPLDSLFIAEAKKHKIPIEMDASLFTKLAPRGVTLVGITGTRGKSTTTHLIYEILKAAKRRVFLGGNIRGQATLPLIKKVKPDDIVILELDSWQLQGFGASRLSPQIAVFTNFMRDHQNYYHGNMRRYFLDKTNIFRFQKPADQLIANPAILKLIKKHGLKIPGRQQTVAASSLPNHRALKLAGEHNRQNVAYAAAAAKALGVSKRMIAEILSKFAGLPGRLEFIREAKGVKYYNDTTATTPDATLAALKALATYRGGIILLGGGADKDLDYREFAKAAPKYLKTLVLFRGAASEKIIKALPAKNQLPVFLIGNMKDGLKLAKASSTKGDVILLSPGAASFGPPPGGFKNEYDRGDQFVRLIKKLK